MEEFNQILTTISQMRENIRELQDQERMGYELRKKAEMEKLMYQINPHFVLNTLYSVQWMAQRDGNLKIREFVHDLTVILSYNLGKENGNSTLRTEVEIARKYIEIQKQRYDFDVMLEIEEGSYLDVPTIHMLLQPLIENALWGIADDWNCGFLRMLPVSMQVLLCVIMETDSARKTTGESVSRLVWKQTMQRRQVSVFVMFVICWNLFTGKRQF